MLSLSLLISSSMRIWDGFTNNDSATSWKKNDFINVTTCTTCGPRCCVHSSALIKQSYLKCLIKLLSTRVERQVRMLRLSRLLYLYICMVLTVGVFLHCKVTCSCLWNSSGEPFTRFRRDVFDVNQQRGVRGRYRQRVFLIARHFDNETKCTLLNASYTENRRRRIVTSNRRRLRFRELSRFADNGL